MNIKEDFHHLIETIDDEQLLNDHQAGNLSKKLNDTERHALLLAYDESFDEKNLLSHEQMKQQHDKWLK